jgi:soluble P-type ATPase
MTFHRIESGGDNRDYAQRLGPRRCAVIGNGRNDVEMPETAVLGIAVLRPEGTHARALAAADVVARSILEALALLAEPTALTATLRA